MKLLMTADTVGGVWTYAIDLCASLARWKVQITLVTLGRPLSPAQKRAASQLSNVQVVQVPCKLEWMADPWDEVARSGEALLDTALQTRPDVIHLNGFTHASLPWDALAIPVVVVGHSCVETWWRAVWKHPTGGEWARYREAVREGIHDADVFVAPTHAMLDAFSECYGPHSDGRVIYNGRSHARHKPGIKRPFVLAAGRLWDQAKNIAALEQASQWLNWPVRIAGEHREPQTGASTGPTVAAPLAAHRSMPRSESIARAASAARSTRVLCAPKRLITPGIERLGRLTPARLAQQMARASIYALPAKYEPFGLSAVEAGLCRCALVLGDIPTLREVWGDAAVFVDPDDPEAIADAVNDLIDDEPMRRHLADAARHRAQRFTPRRMAKQYLDIYRKLAREQPATADITEEQGVTV